MRIALVMMLLMIIFSSAYTFCEDGNEGDVLINSIKDNLDDNTKAWEWEDGQQISLTVNVDNNLEDTEDLITKIIFLDDDDEEVNIVSSKSDLTEEERINDGDSEDIDFSFKIDNNDYSSYNMFVKTYVDGDEDLHCYQKQVEVIVNKFDFDSCVDNNNLTVKIKDYSKSWRIKESEKVEIEIKSLLPKDDYDIDIVLYYDGVVESVTNSETFANGTFSFDFDMETDKEGKYGLYTKVYSNDACAESRIFETFYFDWNRVLTYNYYLISVKDEPGIIVTSVEGPAAIVFGEVTNYTVNLKNTGEDESLVRVLAYNKAHSIKEYEDILNFKKDTTKSIVVSLSTANKAGMTTIEFSADYDYHNSSKSFKESSSTYDHDIAKRVYVVVPYIAPVVVNTTTVPKPPVVVNTTTVPTPVVVEEKESFWDKEKPFWFKVLIGALILSLVVWVVRYLMDNMPVKPVKNNSIMCICGHPMLGHTEDGRCLNQFCGCTGYRGGDN